MPCVDLVSDICKINRIAMDARRTAMIFAGGGVVKHHTCNANLMRNGADLAIYLSTLQEFDGSDSGASPDEAVSWGKLAPGSRHIKVHADPTITIPLLIAHCAIPALRKVIAFKQEAAEQDR